MLLGGQLLGRVVSQHLLAFDMPMFDTGIDTAPEAAIAVIVALYVIAALFNLRIPRTEAPLQPLPRSVGVLVRDFSNCNARLWNDKLGQISLATTTLFWGVSGNLRVIVFAWAAAALGYTTTQASSLVGVVAIGTAAGAIVASMRMRLDQATSVIPLGIAMGVLVIGLNVITNVWLAAPFLIVLGAIGGYLVVPMNALLQHRGANLMGAGRSIAVQNFNEQACILGLGAFYTGMTRFGLSAFTAIAVFGVLVAGTMWLIRRWHRVELHAPSRRDRAPAGDRPARQALTRPSRRGARRRRRRARRWSSTPSSGAPRGGRSAGCRTRACIRSGRRR